MKEEKYEDLRYELIKLVEEGGHEKFVRGSLMKNLILGVSSICLMFFLTYIPFSSALEVKKGRQYPVCHAVLKALEKPSPSGKTISFNDQISSPKWNKLSDLLGLRLFMQSSSYLYGKDINWWEREISDLKKILDSDFSVQKASVDINNDGVVEDVVRTSFYDKRVNSYVVINDIVNKENNLDFSFFKRGRFSFVYGEIFIFDGRVFSLTLNGLEKVEFSVNDHFDSPMQDEGGLAVTDGVCIIKK